MARITDRQKCTRVLEFLAGVRHPLAWQALAAKGFDDAEWELGFNLLKRFTHSLHTQADVPFDSEQQLKQLDVWENTWLPLASAALRRRSPRVHEKVFLNVTQTRGQTLLVTVRVFIDRVNALSSGSDEERTARKLLVQRGLTNEVLAQAQTLLEQMATLPVAPGDGGEAASDANPQEMWQWYLEWSRIARLVVTDRRGLKAMGVVRR